MKKTGLILGIGALAGALIGILRYKNMKERIVSFDDDLQGCDLFEDELSEEKSLLYEIKEDVDKNREEIISLWEHMEALSSNGDNRNKESIEKYIIKKDRG